MAGQGTPLGEILHKMFARYLSVRPDGFILHSGERKMEMVVQIHYYHPIRTFYRDRKPVCRSLDGLRPWAQGFASDCQVCRQRGACIPQIRLALTAGRAPYYLVLSHTSLKNFVAFVQTLKGPISSIPVVIKVRDQQKWGELIFAKADQTLDLFD